MTSISDKTDQHTSELGVRFQSERQDQIVRLIVEQGRVEVSDLADRFAVTTETVRRDLTELGRQGLVRRVHGGAVPRETLRFEPRLAVRHQRLIDEKRRIGHLALEELPSEGTVLIDSGSTTAMLCEAMPSELKLTVVTNSTLNAQILSQRELTEVILLGGVLQKNTLAAVGAATEQALSELKVDVAFIGCDGISADHGLSTPFHSEAAVKRAMMAAARWSVVLVDHSKFGNDQLVRIAACAEVDVIITDSGLDEATAAVFGELGPSVRRA
ncbi:MAG: DeoR/GlpR family DNA-binding transcription regulator [Acidimicrobiia bacterium]